MRDTAGSIRYAKKIAKRNAIRVRRAMYKKPSPNAKNSVVASTRTVRESIKANADLVSYHFRVLAGDQNSLQLELVVQPKRPDAGLAVQVQPVQFALRPPDRHLFSTRKFHRHRHRRACVCIQSAERHPLFQRALKRAVLLLATSSQVFPGQDFPLHKEVIVQQTAGCRQHKWLLLLLCLRTALEPLDQKILVGDDHGLRFARTQFLPRVLSQFAAGTHFPFGSLLRFFGSGFTLETRNNGTAAGALMDGEGFGAHALSMHEDAKRSGVDHLCRRRHWLIILLVCRRS